MKGADPQLRTAPHRETRGTCCDDAAGAAGSSGNVQQAGQNHKLGMGTGEGHAEQALGAKRAPLGLNSPLHKSVN